jgi:hypothetical protein
MKQHVDIRLLGVLKSDLKSYCMAEDVKRGNAWERRMREKTWTNKHTSTMKDRAASPTASASAMENSIGGIPSHHLSIAPRRQHATKTVYVELPSPRLPHVSPIHHSCHQIYSRQGK